MNKFFDWIKDIEIIYENLIKNAKEINLKNIEDFREMQRKKFEVFLEKKNDLVNNALINLTVDSKAQTKIFEDQMDDAIEKIESEFQKQIGNIYELIIDKLGLDF